MDGLEQRLEILQQSGFFDESGRRDLDACLLENTVFHAMMKRSVCL